jgi:hypothetical protein
MSCALVANVRVIAVAVAAAESGIESPKEAVIRNEVLTSTRLPGVAFTRKSDKQIRNGFEARRSAP